jgi:CheY-specific phosphatase CheX
MPERDWAADVAAAAAEVLETMFFVTPVEDAGDAAEAMAGEEAFAVRLTFEGEPCGCFALRLGRRAARTMAADFLAEEPDALSEEQVAGVVSELANMICGSVLSRGDTQSTFRLTPAGLLEDAGHFACDATVSQKLVLEEGLLSMSLGIEEPCPTAAESAF